jgi:hypothetical protein
MNYNEYYANITEPESFWKNKPINRMVSINLKSSYQRMTATADIHMVSG